jgi:hypothetical protein
MTWYWPDWYDHMSDEPAREEPLCGACNDRGRVGRRRCRWCNPGWFGRLQNRLQRWTWSLMHPRRRLATWTLRRGPWEPF